MPFSTVPVYVFMSTSTPVGSGAQLARISHQTPSQQVDGEKCGLNAHRYGRELRTMRREEMKRKTAIVVVTLCVACTAVADSITIDGVTHELSLIHI